MAWDYPDRLYSFYIQTSTAEPSQYVQYCYDAAGNRVMKISRVQGGSGYYKYRIYIGSIFEEYYEVDLYNVNQGYQDEIMIMDNQSKIGSKRMGTTYSDTSPLIKYIFPDHLGSSNVQCKADRSLYNREEYYPFGETSFGSYGKKRYRYCGKERDEESGMYYYGARYYLPWTCRFVSVDPLAGKYLNLTPYNYAGNKPITHIDINGLQGTGDKPTVHAQGSYDNKTDTYTAGPQNKKQFDTQWSVENRFHLKHGSLSKINNLNPNATLKSGQKIHLHSKLNKYEEPKNPFEKLEPNKDYLKKNHVRPGQMLVNFRGTQVTNKEHNNKKEENKFNIDDALDWLNKNATATYNKKVNGHCAKNVRKALEAGGLSTNGQPNYAKNYGPFLKKIGFMEINKENYIPQKGDIRVWDSYPGQKPAAGHIDMWNGKQWLSDFKEHHFYPGPKYQKYKVSYQIYRWQGH